MDNIEQNEIIVDQDGDGEMNFEKYDKNENKPTPSQLEQDSFILKQTLKSLETTTTTDIKSFVKVEKITTTTNTTSNTTDNNTKNNTNNDDDDDDDDDISDDDDEYIINKKKEIENIKAHYSSEEEMIKFNIHDLKLFIDKLEKSIVDLALEFQDDPDPIYEESIKENIEIIEKKKKQLEELENILVKKEGLFL